jgi:hypothetical protein
MKMSRDQLKALVKECLIELLSDGLGGELRVSQPQYQQHVSKQNVVPESRTHRQKKDFDPALDTPVRNKRQASDALRQAIKENANGNPVMESIFADTARTTLQAQLSFGDTGSAPGSEGSSASRITQQEQFSGSPEQVFGKDASSRWASLAFMDAPAKKTA